VFILISRVLIGSETHTTFYWSKGGGGCPSVKRPGREVDNSIASIAEVKNGRGILHFPIRLHLVVFSDGH